MTLEASCKHPSARDGILTGPAKVEEALVNIPAMALIAWFTPFTMFGIIQPVVIVGVLQPTAVAPKASCGTKRARITSVFSLFI